MATAVLSQTQPSLSSPMLGSASHDLNDLREGTISVPSSNPISLSSKNECRRSDELPLSSLATSVHFPSRRHNVDTSSSIGNEEDLHDSASSQLPQNNEFAKSSEIPGVESPSPSSGALVTDIMEKREAVAAEVKDVEDSVMQENEKDDADADNALPHDSSVPKDDAEDSTVVEDAAVTANNPTLAHEETEEVGLDICSLFDENAEISNGCTALIPYNPANNDVKILLAKATDFSSKPVIPHKGLVNLGNTCYLNSALQMIISVEDFVDEIIALYRESIDGDSVQDASAELIQYPLRDALAEFFLSMDCFHRQREGRDETKSANDISPADPSKLKKIIDELTPQFAGFMQQDSHELLSTLLDLLHDEMKQPPPTTEKEAETSKEDQSNVPYVLVGNEPESLADENAVASDGDDTMVLPRDDDSVNENCVVDSRDEMSISSKDSEEDYQPSIKGEKRRKREDDGYIVVQVESNEAVSSHDDDNELSCTGLVEEGAIPQDATMRKTTSYAELSVEDISSLLHDEQVLTQPLPAPYQSWASMAAGNNCNAMTCKLVGGRTQPSAPRAISLSTNTSFEETNEQDDTEQQMETIIQDPSEDIPSNVTTMLVENDEDDENDVEMEEIAPNDDDTTACCETPVDKYFTTKIRTHLTCDSCKFSRSHIETFRYLPIEIDVPSSDVMSSSTDAQHDNPTVQDGLRQFFAPEKRELKCEKCFGESATQTMEIVQLPQAMIIHLKRFIMDASPCYSRISFRKNKDAVEFGDILSLDSTDNINGVLGEYIAIGTKYPECTDVDGDWCKVSHFAGNEEEIGKVETIRNETSCVNKYRLRSNVHHIGSSANCGHYTNDSMKQQTKASEREWFRFNDSHVSTLTPEIALGDSAQKNVYMLMYLFDPGCK